MTDTKMLPNLFTAAKITKRYFVFKEEGVDHAVGSISIKITELPPEFKVGDRIRLSILPMPKDVL